MNAAQLQPNTFQLPMEAVNGAIDEFISEMAPSFQQEIAVEVAADDSGSFRSQLATVISGVSVLTMYAKNMDVRDEEDDEFNDVINSLMPQIRSDVVSNFACNVIDIVIRDPGSVVPDTTPAGTFEKRMLAVRKYCA